MEARQSHVNKVDLNILSFSSIFEIGDSAQIFTFTKVLAVQRQAQIFYGSEGDFSAYPIYNQIIPRPVVTEPISMRRYNESNQICVKNINILAASTSAVLHIGSTKRIINEARVKHIRQLTKAEE